VTDLEEAIFNCHRIALMLLTIAFFENRHDADFDSFARQSVQGWTAGPITLWLK
jgi:hypothetical protein